MNARRCGSLAAAEWTIDAARLELLAGAEAVVVAPERGEELHRAVEVRELDGGDRAAPGGLLPGLERVHDLPRFGHVLDPGELHPLDVADHRKLHTSHLGA